MRRENRAYLTESMQLKLGRNKRRGAENAERRREFRLEIRSPNRGLSVPHCPLRISAAFASPRLFFRPFFCFGKQPDKQEFFHPLRRRHIAVLVNIDTSGLASQSARGLAHSKTLARITKVFAGAERLGLRWPSTAFPPDVQKLCQD